MEYTLEKLEVYQQAETFSDIIWNLVDKWNQFQKDMAKKDDYKKISLQQTSHRKYLHGIHPQKREVLF